MYSFFPFSLHIGVKFVRHVGILEVAISLMADGEQNGVGVYKRAVSRSGLGGLV